MPTDIARFARKFQVWEYSVGHGMLLLRSPKHRDIATRVDILFMDVGFISIPMTLLEGVAVVELPIADAPQWLLRVEPSVLRRRTVFRISSLQHDGFVIAGAVAWHEDTGEYHDPSHFQLKPGAKAPGSE